MRERTSTKLGVYTKAHGFLTVEAFTQGQRKGIVPIRGEVTPTKPEKVTACQFRAKGYNKH